MQFEDVRFLSSVCVILSFFVLFHASAAFVSVPLLRIVIYPFSVAGTVLLFIWFTVFGQWISRTRRATFNEHNLLVTYQPRALTHGHLFVPDPPTPARISADCPTTSDFRSARDAHYKDEFSRAVNTSREHRHHIPQSKTTSMRIEFEDTNSPSTQSDTSSSHHI